MARIKYNIVLDHLEITYTATSDWKNHFKDISETHCERRDQLYIERKPSKIYKYEYNVFYFDEGQKRLIGLLYWGSFNKNRQLVYFCFNNESLYDDFVMACRFYIEDALGLKFERVSKIDIAIDVNVNVVRRFYKVYRDCTYDLILNGTKTSSDMNQYISDIEGHYVGSRNNPYKYKTFYVHNSDRTLLLRGYNKSLEIREESGKIYVEHHAGFGNLHRLEVCCKNHKQIKKSLNALKIKYEEELYSQLQSTEFLISFFEDVNRRLIRFSKKRKVYSLTDLILN